MPLLLMCCALAYGAVPGPGVSSGRTGLSWLAVPLLGVGLGLWLWSRPPLQAVYLGLSLAAVSACVLLWMRHASLRGWCCVAAVAVLGLLAGAPWAGLTLAGALGGAWLIDRWGGARIDAAVLGLLVLQDLVLFRAGLLEYYPLAAWGDQAGALPPWAVLPLGGWQLGAGDLLGLGLLALWTERRWPPGRFWMLGMVLAGLMLSAWLALRWELVLPATPALGAAWLAGAISRRTRTSKVASTDCGP